MKEQLIKNKTKKLARKKGFNLFSLNKNGEDQRSILDDAYLSYPRGFQYEWYDCSQSLLAKWLREEHNIHVNVNPTFDKFAELSEYRIELLNNYGADQILDEFINEFNTYEQALEAGLLKGLKLIK